MDAAAKAAAKKPGRSQRSEDVAKVKRKMDPGGGVIQGPPFANANMVQHSDFFASYARHSGQAAYAVRPPWNVAGVDYPVGVGGPSSLSDLKLNH